VNKAPLLAVFISSYGVSSVVHGSYSFVAMTFRNRLFNNDLGNTVVGSM